MNPQQQQRTDTPSYSTNEQPDGWSGQGNPGFQPNMSPNQATMPTPGSPPQPQFQQNPIQIIVPGPNAFFIVGTEPPVSLFPDEKIRIAFTWKIFVILTCQHAVTAAVIALCLYQPEVNTIFEDKRMSLFLVPLLCGLLSTTFMVSAIFWFPSLPRKWPTNIFLLAFFSIGQSVLLGSISAVFNIDQVLMVFGICTAVCLAITVFTTQTHWDYTTQRGMWLVCGTILLIFSIAAICTQTLVLLSLGCCSLVAIVCSLYYVYDIHWMVSGNHKNAVSPQEHIFVALLIFTFIDFGYVFIRVLRVMCCRKFNSKPALNLNEIVSSQVQS